jgi:hypothetical protein
MLKLVQNLMKWLYIQYVHPCIHVNNKNFINNSRNSHKSENCIFFEIIDENEGSYLALQNYFMFL